jgi:uncharacterized membrane protein
MLHANNSQSFKELLTPSSHLLLRDVTQVTQTLTILNIISTLQPPFTLRQGSWQVFFFQFCDVATLATIHRGF